MPKVSVIMPAYNSGKYIIDAIESVLHQSYSDYELIIIDDGSKDNTREIIMSYDNRNEMRYYYQENSGISAARNKGIELSTGKYIAFLDADDLWMPDKLSESVKYLENNSAIKMVYSDMFIINSSGEVTGQWFRMKKEYAEGDIYENLIKECFIVPTSFVIEKAVLLEDLFNVKATGVEDYDLWMRLARKYRYGLIRDPLVKWRNHDGNYSKNYAIVSEGLIGIFERELKEWNRKDKYYDIIVKRLSSTLYTLGQYYIGKQKYKQANQLFMECLLYKFTMASLIRLIVTALPSKLIEQVIRMKNKRQLKAS
jgi:glycosyltransferase involved in cell wall biosynthesis